MRGHERVSRLAPPLLSLSRGWKSLYRSSAMNKTELDS
jgi:hypothetical protein